MILGKSHRDNYKPVKEIIPFTQHLKGLIEVFPLKMVCYLILGTSPASDIELQNLSPVFTVFYAFLILIFYSFKLLAPL